ncbi:MAG: TonB-dependent receptor plug domain-containing protein [Bacteroidota bacterium]|nr:TonB-dependent receptor plug domain-containing protein [Bacteroidota bacterium]
MRKSPTIFLIDDDIDDQEIFSIALQGTNVDTNCIFANDGIIALEKLNSDITLIPDLIFIDMNMPRMNGQQCLMELKKMDRLKSVPIYMYSTSADPVSIEENKQLGAEDFILKPSDIQLLSSMLGNIIKRRMLQLIVCVFVLTMFPFFAKAQTDTANTALDFKKLTVEQLMNIVVTSVSKTPKKLTEAASAIQVINSEEIRRSGAMRLPKALRLASNLQVAQSGSHEWGITSRGFNGTPVSNSSLANKLLVLIDGRTVYTPLFGGVFWDVQNVLMEDIQQIEVVSGPGGAQWGANAVNGIINVISKSAKETQGWYASGTYGSLLQDHVALRYGGKVDSTLFFRVYGQRFDYNKTRKLDKSLPDDEWSMNQGGFRMDFLPSDKNTFTLQGDLYEGTEDDTLSTLVNGQNILGRWTHLFNSRSEITLQLYVDRTWRKISSAQLKDVLITYDIEFQHNLKTSERNTFSWGMNYRLADDYLTTSNRRYDPPHRKLDLWSVFVQDLYQLVPEKVELTMGTKIFQNEYTKVELHPSIRLAYTPNTNNTIWTAVSRAVRSPTRLDQDNVSPRLGSYDGYKSETVNAYEIGYRVRPLRAISFSIAAFFNQYRDLRSVDTNLTAPPDFYFKNNLEADAYGIELSGNFIATSWWKLRGGYTYLHKTFKRLSPLTYLYSADLEANDPKNQFLIQSMMTIARNFQLDGIVRYVDLIPATFNATFISSYLTFDIRLAYNYKWVTVSVVGENLSAPYHTEFGERQIPRSVYGKISLAF